MVDGKIPGKTAYGRVKNAQHWLGVEVTAISYRLYVCRVKGPIICVKVPKKQFFLGLLEECEIL